MDFQTEAITSTMYAKTKSVVTLVILKHLPWMITAERKNAFKACEIVAKKAIHTRRRQLSIPQMDGDNAESVLALVAGVYINLHMRRASVRLRSVNMDMNLPRKIPITIQLQSEARGVGVEFVEIASGSLALSSHERNLQNHFISSNQKIRIVLTAIAMKKWAGRWNLPERSNVGSAVEIKSTHETQRNASRPSPKLTASKVTTSQEKTATAPEPVSSAGFVSAIKRFVRVLQTLPLLLITKGSNISPWFFPADNVRMGLV